MEQGYAGNKGIKWQEQKQADLRPHRQTKSNMATIFTLKSGAKVAETATREDSQPTQSWQESPDAKADSSPSADLQRKRIKT